MISILRMNNKIMPPLVNFFSSKRFHYSLMAAGIILRIRDFLSNASLGRDEAWVAVSVISQSFKSILLKAALFPDLEILPKGFLWIEKIFVAVLGTSEPALRLFPLLAGLGSIWLFYLLARRKFSPAGVALALTLFVFCDTLIIHAAYVKSYSIDVFCALLLLSAWYYFQGRGISRETFFHMSVLGAILFWCSHMIISLLIPFSVVFIRYCTRSAHNRKDLLTAARPSIGFWIVNILAAYKFVFSKMAMSTDAPGFSDGLLGLLGDGLRIFPPATAFLLFLWGARRLYAKDKDSFLLYVMPVILIFLTAIARRHPLHGELLFSVPFSIVIIVEGFMDITARTGKGRLPASLLIAGILVFQPVTTSARHFFAGREAVDNRTVLKYFGEHYLAGDMILLNNSAKFPFWYYLKTLDILSEEMATGNIFYEGEPCKVLYFGEFQDKLHTGAGDETVFFRQGTSIFSRQGYFRGLLFSSRDQERGKKIGVDTPFEIPPKQWFWVFLTRVEPQAKSFILKWFDQKAERKKVFERNGAILILYQAP